MIELLTPSEMAEADRLAIDAGIPGTTLMERAGGAVADAVMAHHPAAARIVVVAGPGNNGGDGFVAARILAAPGRDVHMLLLGELSALKGDAAWAAAQWQGPTRPAAGADFADADVIVDALFGAGLARPIDGPAKDLIDAMNAAAAPVVAVDLPSGVSGESGAVLGSAVTAVETVTFFRKKPGHLLLPGRLKCGAVQVADIGIGGDVLAHIRPQTFANDPALWAHAFPVPRVDGHKYARGHAVVVSGGLASTGAGRLAARAALRAGAGLVTLASPRDAVAVNAAATLAIMVRPVDGARELSEFLADARLNAVVLGPGGGVGEGLRDAVLAALAGERSVVLDADALTSFAGEPERLFDTIAARGGASTVLTPHGGEFARLFGGGAQTTNLSKLERARAAARRSGAIVVFKGPDTVVAAPGGRAAIAANAPPWLATAGSGDVLAGMIAGLLAQGMPAFEAACAAVWLHGETATAFGPGLISEDLPEAVPKIYRRLIATLSSSR